MIFLSSSPASDFINWNQGFSQQQYLGLSGQEGLCLLSQTDLRGRGQVYIQDCMFNSLVRTILHLMV